MSAVCFNHLKKGAKSDVQNTLSEFKSKSYLASNPYIMYIEEEDEAEENVEL